MYILYKDPAWTIGNLYCSMEIETNYGTSINVKLSVHECYDS